MRQATNEMDSEEAGYRKLNVFKKADELVVDIYEITKSFP